MAATFAIAALSWRYIEDPIRHGALKRLRAQGPVARGRLRARGSVWARSMGAVAASRWPLRPPECRRADRSASLDDPGGATIATPRSRSRAPPATPAQPAALGAVETADLVHSSLVHIGDSTSEGLISHDYLPDPQQRISARYARVGATRVQHYEIAGPRAIVENLPGPAERLRRRAQLAGPRLRRLLGSRARHERGRQCRRRLAEDFDERIDRMMEAVGRRAGLWVT